MCPGGTLPHSAASKQHRLRAEPHSVQEPVWLVVSSPAKKKVATSGSSLSSLSSSPELGSLQHQTLLIAPGEWCRSVSRGDTWNSAETILLLACVLNRHKVKSALLDPEQRAHHIKQHLTGVRA